MFLSFSCKLTYYNEDALVPMTIISSGPRWWVGGVSFCFFFKCRSQNSAVSLTWTHPDYDFGADFAIKRRSFWGKKKLPPIEGFQLSPLSWVRQKNNKIKEGDFIFIFFFTQRPRCQCWLADFPVRVHTVFRRHSLNYYFFFQSLSFAFVVVVVQFSVNARQIAGCAII